MHSSTRLAFGLGALLAGGVAQAHYTLNVTYDITNFFSSFDFFSGPDPTHGFVEYVDAQTANAEGLAGMSLGGVYMGVDSTTMYPANGRKSVRVSSQESFTHGLFIADIAHMPGSICGTWPAYWMFGPDWPTHGEIDIIEGVNTQTQDSITLHTSAGCSITNSGSLNSTTLVSKDCGPDNNNSGCGQSTADNQNYGDGFNANGGGVYATEWTSKHIAVWFFPRYRIPLDIITGTPNPSTWGPPAAKFNGGSGCTLDDHFANHNIVFDTTFCGDWAGNVWGSNSECSALANTCEDYVSANPSAFAEAYWVVNSIKVYNQQGRSTAPYPTPTATPYPPAHPTAYPPAYPTTYPKPYKA